MQHLQSGSVWRSQWPLSSSSVRVLRIQDTRVHYEYFRNPMQVPMSCSIQTFLNTFTPVYSGSLVQPSPPIVVRRSKRLVAP